VVRHPDIGNVPDEVVVDLGHLVFLHGAAPR
jgi:hypothetical protein